MTKETIGNPDLAFEFFPRDDFSPQLSHFEVEHGSPLRSSEHPIIGNLIQAGFEVHETVTTFYMGFPAGLFTLKNHFAAQVRQEYEIRLDDDGFLRFRFEGPEAVYLSLVYIKPDRQRKGLGRKWFKPVTDALFRAGVQSLRGAVSESRYPSIRRMNPEHLTRFYVREAGFRSLGNGYIVKDSPFRATENSARVPKSELVG